MEKDERNKITPSTLYLVATPIGNLADISDRAKKVLSEVDFIAAEDTRNSQKLISALGIRGELIAYHEHNKYEGAEKIIARLLNGESCALITDAGMPAISDPGEEVVKMCYDAGLTVTVVPGACAAVSALAFSGLSTRRFAFEGFLPANSGDRRRVLEDVKCDTHTLIFYEAPHKLLQTLTAMCEVLGPERKISLCREITKLNEEVVRTTLGGAAELYKEREPRGEYVLIVEGFDKKNEVNPLTCLEPEAHVKLYEDEGFARMDAIKKAARDRGISKSEMYKLLL